MPIEFPADQIGLATRCPYCRKETELHLAAPVSQPDHPRRAIFWAVVAGIILLLGIAGLMIALKRAEKWAATRREHR